MHGQALTVNMLMHASHKPAISSCFATVNMQEHEKHFITSPMAPFFGTEDLGLNIKAPLLS
jgi:hypothetical protein